MNFLNIAVERWKTVFSIDLRALAAFRVCLALLILANLFILSFDLQDFYTDKGILPLRLWPLATDQWHWSLHAASGQAWYQILLFSVSAVVAILLAVGYRTRLMSILSWVLLVSLLNRNHFILQAGDQLLVALSFWSMFLPLQARYSIDAALDRRYEERQRKNQAVPALTQPDQVYSLATVAIILQILYLYFFTALLKTGDPWRVTMDAAFYAVSLEHFATPLGEFMRNFPVLLSYATGYVLLVEFIAPLLALSPLWHKPLRLIAVLLLFSLHLAFILMLHIGLFPLIDFTALLLLLPGPVWDRLSRRRHSDAISAIRIYYDRDCGFCKKTSLVFREFFLNRKVAVMPAQSDREMGRLLAQENSWIVRDQHKRHYLHWQAVQFVVSQNRCFKPLAWIMNRPLLMNLGNRLYHHIGANRQSLSRLTATLLPYRSNRLRLSLPAQFAAAFFLYAITVTNIASVKPTPLLEQPLPVRSAIKLVRLDQRWGMFAPKPLVYSLYPVVQGKLRNGSEVDLFNNLQQPPVWSPPEDGYSAYPGYRWRKIYERVDGNTARLRSAYGEFLCKRWNHSGRKHDEQLATLEMFSIRTRTSTGEQAAKSSRHSLWRHWCYPEFAPDAASAPLADPAPVLAGRNIRRNTRRRSSRII